MKKRELSKLQIRAEVTLMLQKFDSIDEMSREQQVKCIKKLGLIKNRDYVVEILAREMEKTNYRKGQIISLFLQEFGTLEQLRDTLWSYIKSPYISDEVKDIAGITLKNLGDNTDPEEFLHYLEDPKAIVDKETKKLLEISSVNPEAQIDFLDFLFSLPESEQFNLIQSLREDYKSEYIVNVTAPALESRIAPHMDEYLMELLGESRAKRAVPVLKELIDFSDNEKIRKKARINLNKLKLSGVDIENADGSEQSREIAKISDIHECYTNIPDGMGNQAVIVSRIKPNGDILMMNLIINDIQGILDCFGFYGISGDDFIRIIERFKEKSTGLLVAPEYCRYIIEQAELVNKKNNIPLSYEYIAWKSAIKDIKPHEIPNRVQNDNKEYLPDNLLEESENLYKFPDFEKWFFENDDHDEVKHNIERIIANLAEKKDYYAGNAYKLNEYIEEEINNLFPVIFDSTLREAYKKRLENTAVLFDMTELHHFRDIAASVARAMDTGSDHDIMKIAFIRGVLRKTVIEGLLRYEYNLYNREQQKLNPWNKRKKERNKTADEHGASSEQSIQELIDILA